MIQIALVVWKFSDSNYVNERVCSDNISYRLIITPNSVANKISDKIKYMEMVVNQKIIHRCRLQFSCYTAQPIWPKSTQDLLHTLISRQIRNSSLNWIFIIFSLDETRQKEIDQCPCIFLTYFLSYSQCDMAAWLRYCSRGACLMSIVKALVT